MKFFKSARNLTKLSVPIFYAEEKLKEPQTTEVKLENISPFQVHAYEFIDYQITSLVFDYGNIGQFFGYLFLAIRDYFQISFSHIFSKTKSLKQGKNEITLFDSLKKNYYAVAKAFLALLEMIFNQTYFYDFKYKGNKVLISDLFYKYGMGEDSNEIKALTHKNYLNLGLLLVRLILESISFYRSNQTFGEYLSETETYKEMDIQTHLQNIRDQKEKEKLKNLQIQAENEKQQLINDTHKKLEKYEKSLVIQFIITMKDFIKSIFSNKKN